MGNETAKSKAYEVAAEHVDWFLRTLRPLLIDHMVHGFKHGVELARETDDWKDIEKENTPTPFSRVFSGLPSEEEGL